MHFPGLDALEPHIESVELPPVARVSYDPPVPQVADVRDATEHALDTLALDLESGDRVALAVGSRGISDIRRITTTAARWVRSRDLEPVIVPAMGSHGGGTPSGQRGILEKLGITEQSTGCRIDPRMTTEQVGSTTIADRSIPVYAASAALEADALVPINRIAPHTSFSGELESGLCKMLVVGIGKREGARVVHRFSRTVDFVELLDAMLSVLHSSLEIPGGIGIIENAADTTAEVIGIAGNELVKREAEALARAKELFPTLPFEKLDVLVVDEMGKNVSGTGMDPNVIGRRLDGSDPPEGSTRTERIYARALTPETQGNANGMGFADAVHRDVVSDIDLAATYANVLTSGYPRKAALPLVLPSDELAINVLVESLGAIAPQALRLTWITNTSALSSFRASAPVIEECDDPHVEIDGWERLIFEEGSLSTTRTDPLP